MSLVDKVKHSVHTAFKATAESVMSTRTTSAFVEKGVVTPEEFVVAGDFLVRQCPTWAWQGGDEKCKKPYLPRDKQFLVTRNVPCRERASAMEAYAGKEKHLTGDDEGWVEAGGDGKSRDGEEDFKETIPDMDRGLTDDFASVSFTDADAPTRAEEKDDETRDDHRSEASSDAPDMEDFVDVAAEEEEDEANLESAARAGVSASDPATPGDERILKTRTYDISISYDKYYQTPRVWLRGYDEKRRPLDPRMCLQDVSSEHAEKTVTIERHPHTGASSCSIHPCKHGSVMKKLIDAAAKRSNGNVPAVEHYLLIFLKFIASVVPTVEYDYTLAI
jgi:ubiquitin-like-conjugating enzyme ATG3